MQVSAHTATLAILLSVRPHKRCSTPRTPLCCFRAQIGMELAEGAAMHLSPIDPPSTTPSAAANVPASSITRDWTCPFCPLLCDDLVVESHDDATLTVPNTECPRLAQALACYGSPDAQCRNSVDGHDADLDTALAGAARILSSARRPLFGALTTDVAGARALYTLAAGCGAILDHWHGDAMSAATLALQDRGSFFTTLSEVRTRADLLVFFHCQPSQRYPRFFTRVRRLHARSRCDRHGECASRSDSSGHRSF
jgi:formylmethanofuran dehydrogenase subunit B